MSYEDFCDEVQTMANEQSWRAVVETTDAFQAVWMVEVGPHETSGTDPQTALAEMRSILNTKEE